VLNDEDLAQAIIDRVLERGRLLRLDGPSVRTLHVNLDDAMKEASDQDADLVRISGKSRSEFPEPTLLIALHLSLVIAVRLLRECIGLVVAGFDAREAGVFPQAAMRQA
jgi:hypothetical protein